MKRITIIGCLAMLAGCATITEDPMTPVAFSFSDGAAGKCQLANKRGNWEADIPGTVSVRKSDDVLRFDCVTRDGREATGSIESRIGAKIVASAVFIDFGITDAITDMHREYPTNFVIPVMPLERGAVDGAESNGAVSTRDDVYTKLEQINDLRERGVITDEEFDAEKAKLLSSE